MLAVEDPEVPLELRPVYRPAHVSAREIADLRSDERTADAAWAEAASCAAVMLANAVTLGRYGAGFREAKSLRTLLAESSEAPGHERLAVAMTERWGWHGTIVP